MEKVISLENMNVAFYCMWEKEIVLTQDKFNLCFLFLDFQRKVLMVKFLGYLVAGKVKDIVICL